jgi:hypothetical protein
MDTNEDPSGLDYLHEITGDAATFINLFSGRQPQTLTAQPAVSVGVTGQSGLLIVLAVVVIGAIWIATKK